MHPCNFQPVEHISYSTREIMSHSKALFEQVIEDKNQEIYYAWLGDKYLARHVSLLIFEFKIGGDVMGDVNKAYEFCAFNNTMRRYLVYVQKKHHLSIVSELDVMLKQGISDHKAGTFFESRLWIMSLKAPTKAKKIVQEYFTYCMNELNGLEKITDEAPREQTFSIELHVQSLRGGHRWEKTEKSYYHTVWGTTCQTFNGYVCEACQALAVKRSVSNRSRRYILLGLDQCPGKMNPEKWREQYRKELKLKQSSLPSFLDGTFCTFHQLIQ